MRLDARSADDCIPCEVATELGESASGRLLT